MYYYPVRREKIHFWHGGLADVRKSVFEVGVQTHPRVCRVVY